MYVFMYIHLYIYIELYIHIYGETQYMTGSQSSQVYALELWSFGLYGSGMFVKDSPRWVDTMWVSLQEAHGSLV